MLPFCFNRSKTGGQILGGMIPVYGQIADARDMVAALRDVRAGKAGSGVLLAAAIIGWVPVVGDTQWRPKLRLRRLVNY